jgi:hypothetical protein
MKGGEQMVQAKLSEKFITGNDLSLLGITKLKILDEGEYVQGNFGEQLTIRVLADDPDKRKFKWSLSAEVNDYFFKTYGSDTAEWVGKEFGVTTKLNKKNNPVVIPKDMLQIKA